jgi:putative hemolysin
MQKTDETRTSAPTDAAGLPNPAAAHCQEQGYRHEIRTAADGSQAGVCIFSDGSECDEWAFFRGECGPTRSLTRLAAASVWLDKTHFEPREEIQVHFVTPDTFPSDAWVGIVPSYVPHGRETTNDHYALDREYLEGQVTGVLTFLTPDEPGSYDLRLNDTDDDGTEVASVTFQVAGR